MLSSVKKPVRVLSLCATLSLVFVVLLGCGQNSAKTAAKAKSGPQFNPQDSEETRVWYQSLNSLPQSATNGQDESNVEKETKQIQEQFNTATADLVWKPVTWRFKVKTVKAESAEVAPDYGPPCTFNIDKKEPANQKPPPLRELPLAAMSMDKARTLKAGDFVTVQAEIGGVSQEVATYLGGKAPDISNSIDLLSVKVKD